MIINMTSKNNIKFKKIKIQIISKDYSCIYKINNFIKQ